MGYGQRSQSGSAQRVTDGFARMGGGARAFAPGTAHALTRVAHQRHQRLSEARIPSRSHPARGEPCRGTCALIAKNAHYRMSRRAHSRGFAQKTRKTEGSVRTAVRALLIVGLVSAGACRESGTGVGDLAAGEFTASVSGNVDADYAGTAYLYEGDSFIPGRRLVLTARDNGAEITIWGGGVLTSGSDFDFQVGRRSIGVLTGVQADLTIEPLTTVGQMYIATGGTLRVTSSTAERVVGEFEFDGIVYQPDRSTRQARVAGKFHAVPGPGWNGR